MFFLKFFKRKSENQTEIQAQTIQQPTVQTHLVGHDDGNYISVDDSDLRQSVHFDYGSLTAEQIKALDHAI